MIGSPSNFLEFFVAREHQVCSSLVPGICQLRYQVFSMTQSYRPALIGGKCRNTLPSRKCSDGSIMESKWSSRKGLHIAPNPLAPNFVDPQDVEFVIKDHLKDRHIGAYQDLAPGGEQFLSRSRKGSHSPGQGQAVHRVCPLQSQRHNDQASTNLRRSTDAQVGRQTPRLDAEFGCGKCVLSYPHSSKASQVLLQPLDATALCQQQQVYRSAAWRLCRCLGSRLPGSWLYWETRARFCRVQKGKELNDFQRNPLDIEILSNLRFGSLEIRDTSVTRVTKDYRMYSTFLTASPGSVLFSRSNLLKRKTLSVFLVPQVRSYKAS